MASSFDFKQFSLNNGNAGLKVGTDGVLLGALSDVTPLEGHRTQRILDIGTGTGVIALMLAQRCPSAEIVAIDIDGASPAGENFRNSPWGDRLEFRNRSLADYMDDGPGEFDLIVSNPPYYDNSLTCPDAGRSAARHTESLSYREVITFAGDFLAADGSLSLILPKVEQQRLTRFAASFELFPYRIWSIRTTPSKPASRMIADLSRKAVRPCLKELTIQDGGGYTDEYKALTKDFYLKF